VQSLAHSLQRVGAIACAPAIPRFVQEKPSSEVSKRGRNFIHQASSPSLADSTVQPNRALYRPVSDLAAASGYVSQAGKACSIAALQQLLLERWMTALWRKC
jgi:hypothetical protein